jgi:NAD(P)-dependent dehydrogenase (short-subunit alcohol dehydrogenase family)
VSKLAGASGFDVAVNYKQDGEAAALVVQQIANAGGRGIAVQGDMSNESDVARVFEAVDSQLGRLTHLVYNCGIPGKMGRVEAMETQALRDVFDVNVFGAFFAARAAILRMSTKQGGKGGAMVLISSITATLGAPDVYVWYAASKGAIDTMTKGLSLELAEDTFHWYQWHHLRHTGRVEHPRQCSDARTHRYRCQRWPRGRPFRFCKPKRRFISSYAETRSFAT